MWWSESTVSLATSICLITATIAIPFHIVIIACLPMSQKDASSVYVIYLVGGSVDIASLNVIIFYMLGQLSLLPQCLMTDNSATFIVAAMFGLRFGQLCQAVLISFNRVIAVKAPAHYRKIFSPNWTIRLLISFQFISVVIFFAIFYSTTKAHWERLSFAYGANVEIDLLRRDSFDLMHPLVLFCICTQLIFTVFIIILYFIMLHSLKSSQFLYLTYVLGLMTCDLESHTRLVLLDVITIIVSVAAPFLLLTFSTSIREKLRRSLRLSGSNNVV